MVLHRPVELARNFGKFVIGVVSGGYRKIPDQPDGVHRGIAVWETTSCAIQPPYRLHGSFAFVFSAEP
jgi:hypothetical protein